LAPLRPQPFRPKGLCLLIGDKVHGYGLYMPNHANITPEDIAYVAEQFRAVAQPI